MIRAAIIAALAASPVHAETKCAPRAAVIAALATKYAETRQSIGISENGLVMEVFASKTGTWTITVTTPPGMTCLVASGYGFEKITEPLGVPS